MAPEYVLTMTCGTASDMYSLGLLIYAVFAKGKPLFECHGELSAFKSNAEEVRIICFHQNIKIMLKLIEYSSEYHCKMCDVPLKS